MFCPARSHLLDVASWVGIRSAPSAKRRLLDVVFFAFSAGCRFSRDSSSLPHLVATDVDPPGEEEVIA